MMCPLCTVLVLALIIFGACYNRPSPEAVQWRKEHPLDAYTADDPYL